MNETDIDNEDFTLRLALNKGLKLIKEMAYFHNSTESHSQASTAKLHFGSFLEPSYSYRNFRAITCSVVYPHRPFFAITRKKCQHITRTSR